jgi:hypothetical protein
MRCIIQTFLIRKYLHYWYEDPSYIPLLKCGTIMWFSGGVSACTLGLGTRLENELKQLYPSVPVIVLEKERFAAWSGKTI